MFIFVFEKTTHMFKNKKIKNIKALDRKLKSHSPSTIPKKGWINTIRRSLNMSMEQLGNKLNTSSQGIYALEKRESQGSITIKKLREAAEALGMTLSYTLIPKNSLEELVENKAKRKAKAIIRRSYQNMLLENQAVSSFELGEQEAEMTAYLKNSLSKTLWEE